MADDACVGFEAVAPDREALGHENRVLAAAGCREALDQPVDFLRIELPDCVAQAESLVLGFVAQEPPACAIRDAVDLSVNSKQQDGTGAMVCEADAQPGGRCRVAAPPGVRSGRSVGEQRRHTEAGWQCQLVAVLLDAVIVKSLAHSVGCGLDVGQQVQSLPTGSRKQARGVNVTLVTALCHNTSMVTSAADVRTPFARR